MIYSRAVPAPPAQLPENLDALFGDLFGQFFGGKLSADLSIDLKLTETEGASGVTRDLVVHRPSECGDCAGRGSTNPSVERRACSACNATGKREVTQGFFKIQTTCADCKGASNTIADPCATCTGTGRVPSEATVSVVVPPNVEHGHILRIEGEGGFDTAGKRGLLHVYILLGDRVDSRVEAFEKLRTQAELADVASLPAAQVYRPPMPAWQVAAIAIVVLGMLAAFLVAR